MRGLAVAVLVLVGGGRSTPARAQPVPDDEPTSPAAGVTPAPRGGLALGLGVVVGDVYSRHGYAACRLSTGEACASRHLAKGLGVEAGWGLTPEISIDVLAAVAFQTVDEESSSFGGAGPIVYQTQLAAAGTYSPVERVSVRLGLGWTILGKDGVTVEDDAGPHHALAVLAAVGVEVVSRPGFALSLGWNATFASYGAVKPCVAGDCTGPVRETVIVHGLALTTRWFGIGR